MTYVIAELCIDELDRVRVQQYPGRLHLRGEPTPPHPTGRVRGLRCR